MSLQGGGGAALAGLGDQTAVGPKIRTRSPVGWSPFPTLRVSPVELASNTVHRPPYADLVFVRLAEVCVGKAQFWIKSG